MIFRRLAAAAAAAVVFFIALLNTAVPGAAADPEASWPPVEFLGRWTGQGRLGFTDGKAENVTCRVTYLTEEAVKLKQTVRCATSGAKIEVMSTMTETPDGLAGTWAETVYNLNGSISGKRTSNGFHVEVKSDTLAANMDLILIDPATQVVEIQFFNSTLLGLTLQLKKG